MKTTFILLFSLAIVLQSLAQSKFDKQTKPIVEEGKSLYRSEMASWYGTDLFVSKFKETSRIGGYLSYAENDSTKCVFFSKDDLPKVIGTITFDTTYHTNTAKVDLSERQFKMVENELYTIRRAALETMKRDTIFKHYKNCNLNLIPIITNGEKKVYILTGPQQNGVVIFGNDYLLNFDGQNKLTSTKRLHKNIIVFNTQEKEADGKEVTATTHSHLPETGDFMIATDICTLMLYERFTTWQQHTVYSGKYFSIWNCKTNQLFVMTKEAIQRIIKD